MGRETVGTMVMLLTVAASAGAQTVTIRTYNNFGVSPEELAAARSHVEEVFAELTGG